jgi:hypothetical protein
MNNRVFSVIGQMANGEWKLITEPSDNYGHHEIAYLDIKNRGYHETQKGKAIHKTPMQ